MQGAWLVGVDPPRERDAVREQLAEDHESQRRELFGQSRVMNKRASRPAGELVPSNNPTTWQP